MDNVACYGSEDKLIDCTYHTDTTEDRHSNDVWINCNVTGASKPATQATSDTIEFTNPSAKIVTDESTTIPSIFGLGLALIALSITILAIIFLIGYIIVYRHKNKPHTNSNVHYQCDDDSETAGIITNKKVQKQKAVGKMKPDMSYALMDADEMESPSHYQECISSTMQEKSEPVKIAREKKKKGVDKSGGLGSLLGQISVDVNNYVTVP
jgi:hypothetical protein